jgi:hypothetical protein
MAELRYRCGLCGRGHDTPDCEACGTALGQWPNPEARPDAGEANQIVAQMRAARGQKPLKRLAPPVTLAEKDAFIQSPQEFEFESTILELEAELALERAAVLAKDKELADLRQRVAERDASALHAIRRTTR